MFKDCTGRVNIDVGLLGWNAVGPVNRYQRFGEIKSAYLQFNPEDGSSISLRKLVSAYK
jgi:hypothetical protein